MIQVSSNIIKRLSLNNLPAAAHVEDKYLDLIFDYCINLEDLVLDSCHQINGNASNYIMSPARNIRLRRVSFISCSLEENIFILTFLATSKLKGLEVDQLQHGSSNKYSK